MVSSGKKIREHGEDFLRRSELGAGSGLNFPSSTM